MKFGIFYEHQIPRPWDEMSEHRIFNESLEQIELADSLGYNYAWEVEHHFLEEYSHSAAPEVFLGAASQRTKNIRLGHGIIQLPTNHPIRVAERVSTLDLLSDGRVELGLGEGAGPTELHPFGARVREKRDKWLEAVRALIPCFTESSVEFHGEYFDWPLRNVIPKPYQKPHPPLWVACSNIRTIADAGRWGMGALGFQFVTPDAARAWVNKYYINITKNLERVTDYPINPNIAMVSGFMCCDTDEEAQEKAAGWTFFIFCLSEYGRNGIAAPGEGNMWKKYQDWRHTEQAQKALKSGLIGSPETIRNQLRQYADANVDQVILLNQAGQASHADICASLELFAKEVMPEFQARQGEQDAWKADVLSGKIELEDLDTGSHKVYTHQNEDIVRYTADELRQMMEDKERAAGGN